MVLFLVAPGTAASFHSYLPAALAPDVEQKWAARFARAAAAGQRSHGGNATPVHVTALTTSQQSGASADLTWGLLWTGTRCLPEDK